MRLLQDCTPAECDAYVEANAAALREQLPADLVFATTCSWARPSGPRPRVPFRRQGARLRARVLDARHAELRPGGAGAGAAPRRSTSARRTSARCSRRWSATSTACIEVPPGVDVDEWRPRPRDEALAGLRRGGTCGPAESRQRERSACRTRATPSGSPSSSPGTSRPSSTSASSSTTRASTSCSRRSRDVDARAVIVGFGDYRRELERARRGADALHRAARAPPPRPPAAARRRDGRAVDLPGGVRHGRRRGGRRGLAPARGAPLRPGRGRRRARGGVPAAPAPPRAFETGNAAELATKLRELLALPPRRPRGAQRRRPARATVERWSWAGVGARLLEPFDYPAAHG